MDLDRSIVASWFEKKAPSKHKWVAETLRENVSATLGEECYGIIKEVKPNPFLPVVQYDRQKIIDAIKLFDENNRWVNILLSMDVKMECYPKPLMKQIKEECQWLNLVESPTPEVCNVWNITVEGKLHERTPADVELADHILQQKVNETCTMIYDELKGKSPDCSNTDLVETANTIIYERKLMNQIANTFVDHECFLSYSDKVDKNRAQRKRKLSRRVSQLKISWITKKRMEVIGKRQTGTAEEAVQRLKQRAFRCGKEKPAMKCPLRGHNGGKLEQYQHIKIVAAPGTIVAVEIVEDMQMISVEHIDGDILYFTNAHWQAEKKEKTKWFPADLLSAKDDSILTDKEWEGSHIFLHTSHSHSNKYFYEPSADRRGEEE